MKNAILRFDHTIKIYDNIEISLSSHDMCTLYAYVRNETKKNITIHDRLNGSNRIHHASKWPQNHFEQQQQPIKSKLKETS